MQNELFLYIVLEQHYHNKFLFFSIILINFIHGEFNFKKLNSRTKKIKKILKIIIINERNTQNLIFC